VAQLRQAKSRFDNIGAQIILVGMGDREQTEIFRRTFAPEFSIVCDPERRLYQAFGLKRAGLFQMASPSMFVKGMKALGSGVGMGLPQGDVLQLSGVFIIDTQGTVRFTYHAANPADHPTPEELLSALSRIEQKDGSAEAPG
jgi:alkyl hydroperoxide reductase subunit AhpC